MKFKVKYPRLIIFFITILIAIVVFHEGRNYVPFHNFLTSGGYFGTFLGGLFYAYGFTAAPSTAVLLVLAEEQNIVLAVLIGGFGALLSDLIIFKFVRYSFIGEIKELEKEKIIKYFSKKEKTLFGRYYKHIFPTFAGFLIASPLPTEFGVTMMANIKTMSIKKFMIIAYLLHSLGILTIFVIGNLI